MRLWWWRDYSLTYQSTYYKIKNQWNRMDHKFIKLGKKMFASPGIGLESFVL